MTCLMFFLHIPVRDFDMCYIRGAVREGDWINPKPLNPKLQVFEELRRVQFEGGALLIRGGWKEVL